MVFCHKECEICNYSLLECDIIKHYHSHKVHQNFQCKFCALMLTSIEDLNRHFLWYHKMSYECFCPLCQKVCVNIYELYNHLEIHHVDDQTPKLSPTRKGIKNSKIQTPPSDANFNCIKLSPSLQVAGNLSKTSDSITNNCIKLNVCEGISLNAESAIPSDLCSNSQMSFNSCIEPELQDKVYSKFIEPNFIPENCSSSRVPETTSKTMTPEITNCPELSICEKFAVAQDDSRPSSKMSATSIPVINVEDMRNGREIIIPGNVPSVVVNLFVGNNSEYSVSSTPVISINEKQINFCDGSKALKKTSNNDANLDCDTLLASSSCPSSKLSLTLTPITNKEASWEKLKTPNNVFSNVNKNFETLRPCSSLSIIPVSSVNKDKNLTMNQNVSSSISLNSEKKADDNPPSSSRVIITPILPNKQKVNVVKETKIKENVNLKFKTITSNSLWPNSRKSSTTVELRKLNKPENGSFNSSSLHFRTDVTHSNTIVTNNNEKVKCSESSVIPENLSSNVKNLNFAFSISNTQHPYSKMNKIPTLAINEECAKNWVKSKTCHNNSFIDDVRAKIPISLQITPVSKERLTVSQSSKSPTSMSGAKSKSSFEISHLSEKSTDECKMKEKINLNEYLVPLTPDKISTEVKSACKLDYKAISMQKRVKLISRNHKLETTSSMVKKLEVSCPITLTSSNAECNQEISSQFPLSCESLLVKHNDKISISCEKSTFKVENSPPKKKENVLPISEPVQLDLKNIKSLIDSPKNFHEGNEKECKAISQINICTNMKNKMANETFLSVNEIDNLSQNTLMNEKPKSPRRNIEISKNKEEHLITRDGDEVLPKSKRKCKKNKSFTNINDDLTNNQILKYYDTNVLTSKSCSPKKLHKKECYNHSKISPLKVKPSYSNQELKSKNKESIQQHSCAIMKKSTSEGDIELIKKFLQCAKNPIINYDYNYFSSNNICISQSLLSKLELNDFHCFLPQVELERLPICPQYLRNSIRVEDVFTNFEMTSEMDVQNFDKSLQIANEYHSKKSSNSSFSTKITTRTMCNVLRSEMSNIKNQFNESVLSSESFSVSAKSLNHSTLDKSMNSLKQSGLNLRDKKRILEKLLLKVEEKEEKKYKKRMEKLQKNGQKSKKKSTVHSCTAITSAKFDPSNLNVPEKSLISTISTTDMKRNIRQASYPGDSSLNLEATQNKMPVLEHTTYQNKNLPNVGKRKAKHTKAKFDKINCSNVKKFKRTNEMKRISSKSVNDHTNLLSQNSQSTCEFSENSDDEIQILFVSKPKNTIQNIVKVEPGLTEEPYMDINKFSIKASLLNGNNSVPFTDNAYPINTSLLNAKLAWDLHKKSEKKNEKSEEIFNSSIDLPPPNVHDSYTISCPCGGNECNGSDFCKVSGSDLFSF